MTERTSPFEIPVNRMAFQEPSNWTEQQPPTEALSGETTSQAPPETPSDEAQLAASMFDAFLSGLEASLADPKVKKITEDLAAATKQVREALEVPREERALDLALGCYMRMLPSAYDSIHKGTSSFDALAVESIQAATAWLKAVRHAKGTLASTLSSE